MYATSERIRLIKRRAGKLRQKREKRFIRTLFTLCLSLAFALVLTFAAVTKERSGVFVREMFGATLMFEDAGAYVLVAILSFTAAVIITILCLRHRQKGEMTKDDHSQQQDMHRIKDGK